MFQSIKDRVQKLISPSKKSPLGQIFKNPEYVQDASDRDAQVLFLKLLMATAYLDDNVETSELNLIKDYAFGRCLSETEWREIDFYRQVKPSKQEIENMVKTLVSEIQSKAQKAEFMEAINDMVEADDIVQDEEKEILNYIKKQVNDADISYFSRAVGGIRKGLKDKGNEYGIDSLAAEYASNPIAPHLKNNMEEHSKIDITLVSAKLGIAMLIIYCDNEFHSKELSELKKLVEKECEASKTESKNITESIVKIPDTHYELTHLSRIITESCSYEQKKDFLEQLFVIARSDNEFHIDEENYLRVVTHSLLLSHKDFIDAKLKTR
ncbi:MAG: TerB family tellurite resistance protein [Leptospirales bacterium]